MTQGEKYKMLELTRDEFNQRILDLIEAEKLKGNNGPFAVTGKASAPEGISVASEKVRVNSEVATGIYFNKIKLIDSQEELDMLDKYGYEKDIEEPLYLTEEPPVFHKLLDPELFKDVVFSQYVEPNFSTIDVSSKKCFQDMLPPTNRNYNRIIHLRDWDLSNAVTLRRFGLIKASLSYSRGVGCMSAPITFLQATKNVEDWSNVGGFSFTIDFDELDLTKAKKIDHAFSVSTIKGKIKITKNCKYLDALCNISDKSCTFDFSESDFTGLIKEGEIVHDSQLSYGYNYFILPTAEKFNEGFFKKIRSYAYYYSGITLPNFEAYLKSGIKALDTGSSYNGERYQLTPTDWYKDYAGNVTKCPRFGVSILEPEVWCVVMLRGKEMNFNCAYSIAYDNYMPIKDFEKFKKDQLDLYPEEEGNIWEYVINGEVVESINEEGLNPGDVIMLRVRRPQYVTLNVNTYEPAKDFPFYQNKSHQFKSFIKVGVSALGELLNQYPELEDLDIKDHMYENFRINRLKYSGWSGLGLNDCSGAIVESLENHSKSVEGYDVVGQFTVMEGAYDTLGYNDYRGIKNSMEGKYLSRECELNENFKEVFLTSKALGYDRVSWMLPGVYVISGVYGSYTDDAIKEAALRLLPFKINSIQCKNFYTAYSHKELKVEPEVVYYKDYKLPIYKENDTLKDVLSSVVDAETLSQVSINILDIKGNLITEGASLDTVMNGGECIEIKEGTCEVKFLEKVETPEGVETKVLKEPVKISEVKTLHDILEEEKDFEFPSYIESPESIRSIYINGVETTDLDTDLLKDDSIEIVYSYKNYHEEEREYKVDKVIVCAEQGECRFKFKIKDIDFDKVPWGQSIDCVCDNGWGKFNINPWMHNGDGFQGYLGNPDGQGNCVMSIWAGEPWTMELSLKDDGEFGFEFEEIVNAKLLTINKETVKVLN